MNSICENLCRSAAMIWTTEPFGPGPGSLELSARIQGDSGHLKVIKSKKKKKRIMETVKNRNNRKMNTCSVFDCNLLSANLFQPKIPRGILRIIRKNFAWVYGGRRHNLNPNRCPAALSGRGIALQILPPIVIAPRRIWATMTHKKRIL